MYFIYLLNLKSVYILHGIQYDIISLTLKV